MLSSWRSTTARRRRSRSRQREGQERSSDLATVARLPKVNSRAVSRVRPAFRELDQRITRSVAVRQSPDSVAWLLTSPPARRPAAMGTRSSRSPSMRSTVPGDVDRAFAPLPWSAVTRGAQGDTNLPQSQGPGGRAGDLPAVTNHVRSLGRSGLAGRTVLASSAARRRRSFRTCAHHLRPERGHGEIAREVVDVVPAFGCTGHRATGRRCAACSPGPSVRSVRGSVPSLLIRSHVCQRL
jgi:hypothetical protein